MVRSLVRRVSVLDYDFGTWTNIVVDASGLSNNNALIEIWTEEVQGLDNIILIVSESPQAFQYGNFMFQDRRQKELWQFLSFHSEV